MELWVRSQDKESLIKVEKIELIYDCLCSDDIQLIHIETDKGKIGSYSTKERALEVLDEIQNLLNPMLVFKNCNCTQEMLGNIKEAGACVVSDNAHIEKIQTCIYEMPSE